MAIRWLLTVLAWMMMLDGAISCWSEASGRSVALIFLRTIFGLATFLYGLTLYAGCAFTLRMPKRFLVVTGLFLIWGNLCAAYPLPLWLGRHTGIAIGIIELFLGFAVIVIFRGRERLFPLQNPSESRPLFTWKNFLIFSGANVLLLPLAMAFCIAGVCVNSLEKSTAGFMKIRPTGIYMQERLFEKGKERVRLIGMMHIAQKKFYDTILADVSQKEKSVVLLEGVTDNKKIMNGNDLGMRRLSKMLGIDSQTESSFTENARAGLEEESNDGKEMQSRTDEPIRYLRADRDLSDFRPQTIAFLREIGALAACHTWNEILQRLSNPASPLFSQQSEKILMEDILDGRNEFVLAKIKESTPAYDNVIVPWGAMHMPFLEQKLLEAGFHETRRTDHKALVFF